MGDPTAVSVLNYRCCLVPKPLCCLCLGAAFWLSRRTEGLAAVISRGLDRPGSLGNSSWGPLSLKQNLLLLKDVNLKINAAFIAYCKCASQHGALQHSSSHCFINSPCDSSLVHSDCSCCSNSTDFHVEIQVLLQFERLNVSGHYINKLPSFLLKSYHNYMIFRGSRACRYEEAIVKRPPFWCSTGHSKMMYSTCISMPPHLKLLQPDVAML